MKGGRIRGGAGPWLALSLSLALGACNLGEARSYAPSTGGDPRQGARLIAAVGCGSCHSIPGVQGANGKVGPPLDGIADRGIIAGVLANTPSNMVTWLKTPQSVVPGNAMPNMGLNENDARDVAAYLYTLH